jgi:hypothetical protein
MLIAQPLPLAATANTAALGTIPTSLLTYDIAFEFINNGNAPNNFWVATNHATAPIRAYDTGGALTQEISLVANPRAIAFSESGGHRYVWASSISAGMIYQIDLDYGTGIGEEGGAPVPGRLQASSNPFTGSVSFTGCPDGTSIEIYDTAGRTVHSSSYSDGFTWSPSAPAGVYLVRVASPSGGSALSLVRTD